jgi:hypothetical protein
MTAQRGQVLTGLQVYDGGILLHGAGFWHSVDGLPTPPTAP